MNAIETAFRQLHAAGVTLSVDGELLRARPTSLVTKDLGDIIRLHKSELMKCLSRSVDLGPCPNCDGDLIAIPTFDGFENLECLPCDQCAGCRRITT